MKRIPSKVLVIDDDAMVRRAYQRVLGPVSLLTVVGGGEEALAVLDGTTDFDLVICDLTMPRMDGRALLGHVRERFPHVVSRMVFCSGMTDPDVLSELFESTGNEVLRKPVPPTRLRSLVTSPADSGPVRVRESGIIGIGMDAGLREAL